MIDKNIQKLLNTSQAAERLTLTPQTLECWRSTKRYQLPYVKVGRLVRYREQDIEQFINSRLRSQTPC